MSRLVLATSITHILVAAGHTVRFPISNVSDYGTISNNGMNALQLHGINTFALPQWSSLPPLLRCYARAGWYQGSVFFTIAGACVYAP